MASHPTSSEFSKRTVFLTSLFSVLMGAGILIASARESDFPPRESLAVAHGKVAWTDRYKYGVRFGFAGDGRKFDYLTKSDDFDLVMGALKDSGRPEISVLFDPKHSTKPIYSDDAFFTVYELKSDHRLIQSYDAVREAWTDDDRIGIWLGIAFVFSGCGLPLFCKLKQSTS
jgi:hypothetical protein